REGGGGLTRRSGREGAQPGLSPPLIPRAPLAWLKRAAGRLFPASIGSLIQPGRKLPSNIVDELVFVALEDPYPDPKAARCREPCFQKGPDRRCQSDVDRNPANIQNYQHRVETKQRIVLFRDNRAWIEDRCQEEPDQQQRLPDAAHVANEDSQCGKQQGYPQSEAKQQGQTHEQPYQGGAEMAADKRYGDGQRRQRKEQIYKVRAHHG